MKNIQKPLLFLGLFGFAVLTVQARGNRNAGSGAKTVQYSYANNEVTYTVSVLGSNETAVCRIEGDKLYRENGDIYTRANL